MDIEEETESENKSVHFNQYVQNNSNGEMSISVLNDLILDDEDDPVDYNSKK